MRWNSFTHCNTLANNIMPNIVELLKCLIDHRVEFVLIGGFAATMLGSSVITHDLDICMPFNEKNFTHLLSALRDVHPRHRENKQPLTNEMSRLLRFKNLYLLTDWGPLDILGTVSELGSYADLLPHTIEIELFDRRCRVLDIDALITSKRAIARPKDKEVILQLRAIQERLTAKK